MEIVHVVAHLFIGGDLGSFYCLAVINSASVDTEVQRRCRDHFETLLSGLSDAYPEVRSLAQVVALFLFL